MRYMPAKRHDSKLIVCLYGESGSGKTFSALMLARGLVGPGGKIALLDTESGRGSLYADVIPGGYLTDQMAPPFHPKRFVEALDDAEKGGIDVLVIDSGSHEWEGDGGVLDMAGAIEKKTGKSGLHCWAEPKSEHGKWLLRMLQSPIHVIICLRAKHKSRQVKVKREGGGVKTEIVKDEEASPIQSDTFIFEMTAHAEIRQDHTIRLTKCSHPAMLACWPKGEPISIETGRKLAEWCRGAETKPAVDRTEEAERMADQGRDAFLAWWQTLPAADRDLLRPKIDDLKERAQKAGVGSDAATAEEI